MIVDKAHFDEQVYNKYTPYSITISTLETIQYPLFTMVISPLDAILSSRTSVAILLPWFGTAYGRYSWRIGMLLWLWYCKWRTIPSQRILSAIKIIL